MTIEERIKAAVDFMPNITMKYMLAALFVDIETQERDACINIISAYNDGGDLDPIIEEIEKRGLE